MITPRYITFKSNNVFNCRQKKKIQALTLDRCKQKMNRCKSLPACKQHSKNGATFFGDQKDMLCGTDSKTYNNECELARATCL